MLKYVHSRNVGLAPDLQVEWAEHLSLLAGDNRLGKSFLLDLAWWALIRTSAGSIALPMTTKKATIDYAGIGKSAQATVVSSEFHRPDAS